MPPRSFYTRISMPCYQTTYSTNSCGIIMPGAGLAPRAGSSARQSLSSKYNNDMIKGDKKRKGIGIMWTGKVGPK